MQLGFAIWPLMRFTGEKNKMGEFVNPLWIKILGWTTAAIIIVLNVKLLFDTFMPASVLKIIYGHLGLPVSATMNRIAMYKKILVALENGPADETMLPQITQLARRLGSELLLLHVADGWAARSFDQLKLAESEEMKNDRAYLEKIAAQLRAENLVVSTMLAMGNPPAEILKVAEAEHCDLIAMTEPRPPFLWRHFSRQHHHPGPPPHAHSAFPRARGEKITSLFPRVEPAGRSTRCNRLPSRSAKNRTRPPPPAGLISSVNFTPRFSNSLLAASSESTRRAR